MKAIGTIIVVTSLLPTNSFADLKAGEKKAQLCLLCHKAANVTAPMANMPLLEGQPARYVYLQTKAYKEKRRPDPVMQANVANLSDRDLQDIADYFAAQKAPRASFQLDSGKIAVGRKTADELKCATCHLPMFYGKDEIPRLAGQTPGYLHAQLEAFGSGKRAHGSGHLKAPAVSLRGEELEALAHFFASVQ